MAADPLSPIAPARVRVLVLPAGRIKKERFLSFLDRLQHEQCVRLGDISPDGRPDRTMFSPLAFPYGSLLYHFSTAMPPPSHLQLAPFDLFREPMMILGLADAVEYSSSPRDELKEVADQLAEQHPRAIVSQLLVMDYSSEHQESWLPGGAICVPPSHASKVTTMKTIMCDISAKFLSELSTYAKAVQALPSVQSPGAPSRPSNHRPPLDHQSSLRTSSPRPDSPSNNSAVTSPSETPPSRGPHTSSDDFVADTSQKPVSRDRMSVQAYSSTSAQERARNKGKARVGIVVGNLYMLAGRWNDAWRELVENTNRARTAMDYLWYAKGLESIVVCMQLLIWAGFDFPIPAICNSGPDRSSSLISSSATKDGVPSIGQQDPTAAKIASDRVARLLPDLVPTIIAIYERTCSLAGESISPIVYSESVLRLAKLLVIVQNSGGQLDSATLQKIVAGTGLSLYQSKPNAGFSTGFSKHAIADITFRAYPPHSAGVSLTDTMAILAGMVSILSMLGLERKKAIILKELVTLLVPALVQARKVGAAEMGIHPAASLSSAFGIGLPLSTSGDEKVGLGDLLRDLHSVYGARDRDHLDADKGNSDGSDKIDSTEMLVNTTIALVMQSAHTKSFGSLNLKVDILRACIDFCEALPDLAGVVHFAALLLRVVGPQGTMSSNDTARRVTLVTEEQLRLMSNMTRTINAASKIGVSDIRALYWDDFLVRDVKWIDDANDERLRERHKSDLIMDSNKRPGRSPFLYNPFAKQTHKTEDKIVVVGEPVSLTITLQNPYDFDVKIEYLSIVTEGPSLDIEDHPLVLGPSRIQDVTVSARATEVGAIRIIGCTIQIYGCQRQMFPIYQEPWAADHSSKIASIGLSSRDSISSTTQTRQSKARSIKPALPKPSTTSAVAIQAQPHVTVERISLSESALMVLEGQRKTFQITLRNTSANVPVDFVHVSFEDSLTSSIHTALSSKEVQRAEMYDLELELSQNPTFTWNRSDGNEDSTIAPGQKATFNINVLGKPGLGAAKVMFDYACLGKPFSEVEGRAFTRQVSVPIEITVNSSIQLHRVDITEFPANFAWRNQQRKGQESINDVRPKSSDRFRSLLDGVGLESANEEHCLMLLDLRNSWPNPLTVSLQVLENINESTEGERRAHTVQEVIHPGHIARLVLLLPRLHIQNPYAQIPTLSQQNQRQFVVSADGPISADVERSVRESFWFREQVLKYLHGTWEEKGSHRHGNIDLRGIRLSHRMLDTLRLQDLDIRMECVGDDEEVRQVDRNQFVIAPESLVTLRTSVRNRSQVPIRAMLRLQPSLANQTSVDSALDISRRFLWSGLLQQVLPTIPAGETVHVDVGVSPLVNGEFDVTALVEETVLPSVEQSQEISSGTEHEDFEAGSEGLARKERRVWRGEEACRLVVVTRE